MSKAPRRIITRATISINGKYRDQSPRYHIEIPKAQIPKIEDLVNKDIIVAIYLEDYEALKNNKIKRV